MTTETSSLPNPSSKRKTVLILAVVAVIAVLFFFRGQIAWYFNPNTYEAQRAKQVKADEKIIFADEQGGDPATIYGAELRLAYKPSDRVKKRIIDLSRSSNATVRAGAAFFLSSQNDSESMGALRGLMKDTDRQVRVNIARGLNMNPNSERTPLIREFLSSGTVTDQERVQAFAALYRSSTTQGDKDSVLKTLIDFAENEKNPSLSQMSALELFNLAPYHDKVVELMKKAIQKKTNGVAPIAFRTMAVKRDPWILQNLDKLIHDSNLEMKKAVLDTLHFVCPENRWEILEKGFRDEKNPQFNREWWLAEAERMPGESASKFYEKLLGETKVEADRGKILNSMNRMKASRFKDPCTAVTGASQEKGLQQKNPPQKAPTQQKAPSSRS